MGYPWQNLNPKDTIIVQLNQWISETDIHVLTRLYKPILNQQAFGLFMTLNSIFQYSDKHPKEILLSTILSQMDIGIPEFYQARIRLEGLGLLSVYRKKNSEDMYIYEVNKPLEADRFLNEPILKTLLYEKIGETPFKELIESFEIPNQNTEGFEDITKSFLDVYHFKVERQTEANTLLSPNIRNKPVQTASESILKDSTFDWDFFKEGINKHFINFESFTQDIKKLITTFHTLYGIDELNMQRYVLEAADVESGNISKERLDKTLQRAARQITNKSIEAKDKVEPLIQQKNEENTLVSQQLNEKGYAQPEIELIEAANSNTPGEYIKSIKDQKRGFVSDSEAWTIRDLVEQSSLPTPVINIIIQYVLVVRGNATLDKNFSMKIANDWAQKSITTAEEALDLVKELYAENQEKRKQKFNSRNQTYNKKIIRKETMPKWAKKETKIDSQDEQVDPEAEKKLREQLRRIRENK